MITIRPMTEKDIDAVLQVEEACFTICWTRSDFERELTQNAMAIYFVALEEEQVIGYAGMWHVVKEGQETNIAVLPEYRRKGVGAQLLTQLIETAKEKEMIGITLEVKISNYPAQQLYTKYGFRPEGFRKNYYQDTHEDAIIMWKYFSGYEEEAPCSEN